MWWNVSYKLCGNGDDGGGDKVRHHKPAEKKKKLYECVLKCKLYVVIVMMVMVVMMKLGYCNERLIC